MKLNKSCATCKFNCGGFCGGGKYSYGDKITDRKYVCGIYGSSITYHLRVIASVHHHLVELCEKGRIDCDQLADMI